jgi:AcrR family transcriptional regulator
MIPKARKQATRVSSVPRRRGTLDQVLITTAMDLFASYGYRGTSLARIARAAGVTKGALYWHFADKEQFFLAVADRVLREWSEAIVQLRKATTIEEFRAEFMELFEVSAVLNEKNPWVSRLLLIITLESHKISSRVLRAMRRANNAQFENLRQIVARGQELGALDRELDVDWASTQIWSSMIGLQLLWYLHGPRFDLKRSFRRQARELLRLWGSEK